MTNTKMHSMDNLAEARDLVALGRDVLEAGLELSPQGAAGLAAVLNHAVGAINDAVATARPRAAA